MRRAGLALFAGAAAFACGAGPAGAHHAQDSGRLDEAQALAVSQAAVGGAVGDHAFTDSRRRPLSLARYRGQPLVVSLIYTSCPDVCPTVSETLARAVAAGQGALGRDSFRVVSVGFDARHDSPERLRVFAASRGLNLANWDFLSGDAATIDRLARDLGFVFHASAKGFDHLTQTTIVDAEGRVYRQVYGPAFEPPAIVEPLKELVFGRRSDLASLGGLVNRVRLLCTIYDPASGRYAFDYSIFISAIGGLASLGAVAFVLVRAWARGRRAAGGA